MSRFPSSIALLLVFVTSIALSYLVCTRLQVKPCSATYESFLSSKQQKPKKCISVRAAKDTMPIKNESSGIEVRTSRIGGTIGRGVFALKKFRKNDVIEKCPLLVAHDDDWGDDHPLSNYLFEHSSSKQRSALALGMGSLYNHAGSDCNADYAMDGDAAIFRAIRTIRPGEEITIDYGDEWWVDERPDVQ
jgi:uncharacterized protein